MNTSQMYRKGLRVALSYAFTYFSLLNVVLVLMYASRETTYTFWETIRHHFLYYYIFFIIPFIIACVVGKRLLYTEYPKLIHIVMPLISAVPFIFFRPGRCGIVSCTATMYYSVLAAALLLAIKKSFTLYNDHGDYLEFARERQLKVIKYVVLVILNLIVLAGIPFLNGVHATNAEIIANLNSYSGTELTDQCEQIYFNNPQRALCLLHAASTVQDPNLCGKIRRLITENADADKCYKSVAVFKNQISLCDKVLFKDDRYACYYSFAPLNDELCKQIGDADFQVECFSDCEKIKKNTQRDACFYKKAEVTSDVSFCNRISEDITQQRCQALTISDANDCAKITDQATKNECYYSIGTKTKDPTVCARIKELNSRDLCIKEASTTLAQCAGIASLNIKETCVAALAGQESDCDALTKDASRESCYTNVAAQTGDINICKKITDESRRTVCETRV